MARGKVKTLNTKHFGFITPEDGDKDVFFHSSALEGVQFDDLRVGDTLEFDTQQGDKGIRAVKVKLVKGAA